jgi:hypothetical protein
MQQNDWTLSWPGVCMNWTWKQMHNTGSDQIQAAARVPAAASLHTTEQQQSTSCRDAAAWREQRLGNECCSAATPACTWPPSLMSCSSVFLHLVPLLSCADTQRRVTSSPVLPFGTGSPATYAMGCDCICVELWCVCVLPPPPVAGRHGPVSPGPQAGRPFPRGHVWWRDTAGRQDSRTAAGCLLHRLL